MPTSRIRSSTLDPTQLTTHGGRAFLHKLGGAAGDVIADNYVKVLAATKVKGYPFVKVDPSQGRNRRGADGIPSQ